MARLHLRLKISSLTALIRDEGRDQAKTPGQTKGLVKSIGLWPLPSHLQAQLVTMRTTETQASETSETGRGGGGPAGPGEPASSTDVEDSYALERSRWELAEVSDLLSKVPALLASLHVPGAISVNSRRSRQGWKVQPIEEKV